MGKFLFIGVIMLIIGVLANIFSRFPPWRWHFMHRRNDLLCLHSL
ncbi:MAG: hypothetical protein M5R42_01430 [Rhodocyclaceae bacterium]|nr:hypothetical protein [Rhodocyclaceae bacterium]